MRWWRVKAGAFVWERVWRTSALERERKEERERIKERRRERERRRRKRESAFSFLFTFPSLQFMVRFTSYLFLDAQWWRGNTLPFLFSLTQSLSFSLYFFNSHTPMHTISLPLPLPLSPFHLCVFSIFCVSHHEYMWCLTNFSEGKCFFHWRLLCVLRERAKAEKWREREREREWESNW